MLITSKLTFIHNNAAHGVQDGEQLCRYRLVQDGLPLLLPHITRQLLQPTLQEFLHLIEGRSVFVPEEARSAPAAPTNGLAAADQVTVKDQQEEQVGNAGIQDKADVAELDVIKEEVKDEEQVKPELKEESAGASTEPLSDAAVPEAGGDPANPQGILCDWFGTNCSTRVLEA